MIKVKVDLDGRGKPMVVLYLDGEFQTVYGGDGDQAHYRTVEDCIKRAKEIQEVIPFQQLEITKEAVEKLTIMRGISVI